MANRWDKPGIPHKGWHCVNVIDLGPGEYDTCEMCDQNPIRFVHVMEHDDHAGPLNVGCVCAEKMSNDYDGPKAREKQLRNKAACKNRWPSLKKWKTSQDGSSYLVKSGMWMTVFRNKYKPGNWKYGISYTRGTRPKLSKDSYPTEKAAKLALFEPYWEKTTHHGNLVSSPTRPTLQRPHRPAPSTGSNRPEGVIIHKKTKAHVAE